MRHPQNVDAAPCAVMQRLCAEGAVQQLDGDRQLQSLASTCDERMPTLQSVSVQIALIYYMHIRR